MKKEIRTLVYDDELKVEAYRFEGIVQPFPNHFHEYYVIGFVEKGQRILSCKNRSYTLEGGSIVLFNPGDNHSCVQNDGGTFDYRGLNISKDIMLDLVKDVTGEGKLPRFSENVILDDEAICYLRPLHEAIMRGRGDFEKEEMLLFLISCLIEKYQKPFAGCALEWRKEVERACRYMEEHFMEAICLDQICCCAGLGKSTLLRAFTKSKGITPYRYLETIRINEAKKLMSQGTAPAEAAMRTGFFDQSHFTNYFHQFIGLTPGIYREMFSERESSIPEIEKATGNKKKEKRKDGPAE